MSEAEEPVPKASSVARLLFKAVKGLPEEEQSAVIEFFFARGIGTPQPPLFGHFLHEAAQLRGPVTHIPGHEHGAMSITARKPMGPDQITIPVRLSEAQHQRLKQWSADHNFPMAVVVRGLIERFLDSWEERTA